MLAAAPNVRTTKSMTDNDSIKAVEDCTRILISPIRLRARIRFDYPIITVLLKIIFNSSTSF